jgi:hypothetical protein
MVKKNLKTTLVGILGAFALLLGSAIQNKQADPNAPPVTAGNLLLPAIVAAMGVVAKDHDTTGGN